MRNLAADPRPRQCRKLRGATNSYRIRVGEHRVLYRVFDNEREVVVYAVGRRDVIYRGTP